MTPTEQDNELRPIAGLKCPACKLSTLFLASGDYITCGNLQCEEPDYAQAITADRKRVALEARIDEMKLHRHEWELFGDRPPYEGESVSLPILLAYHNDRIAELKAQQEEL